jgi:hypothetical protein
LEKGVLALVCDWSVTGIILSVKVKVLGGGLCAYGWVTILLYCLWKNEHISFILTYTTSVSIDDSLVKNSGGTYNLCEHRQTNAKFRGSIQPL